jgi:hypothetical protein
MAFFNLSPAAVIGLTSGITETLNRKNKENAERAERLDRLISANVTRTARARQLKINEESKFMDIGERLLKNKVVGDKLNGYTDSDKINLGKEFAARQSQYGKFNRPLSDKMFMTQHLTVAKSEDGTFKSPYRSKISQEPEVSVDDPRETQGFFDVLGDIGASLTGSKVVEQQQRGLEDSAAEYAEATARPPAQFVTEIEDPQKKITDSSIRVIKQEVFNLGKIGKIDRAGQLETAAISRAVEAEMQILNSNIPLFVQEFKYNDDNIREAAKDIQLLAQYVGYLNQNKGTRQQIKNSLAAGAKIVDAQYWSTLNTKDRDFIQKRGIKELLEEAKQFLGDIDSKPITKNNTAVKEKSKEVSNTGDDSPSETTTDQKTKLQSYNERAKQDVVRRDAIRIGATSQAIDKIIESGTKEDADEMFETLQKRFKGAFAKPVGEGKSFRLYEIDVPSTEGGFIKYQVKEPIDEDQPIEFIKGKAVQ